MKKDEPTNNEYMIKLTLFFNKIANSQRKMFCENSYILITFTVTVGAYYTVAESEPSIEQDVLPFRVSSFVWTELK